jgi:hypothetical protein
MKKRNNNGGYTQAIKVPLTLKRELDGVVIVVPNTHPKAGKTIFVKHKPKIK